MAGSEDEGPSKPKITKFRGASTYKSKFNSDWTSKYPCIVADKSSNFHFRCTTCNKTLSCKHMGWRDVQRHIEGESHTELAKIKSSSAPVSSFFIQNTISEKVIRAEVKIAHLIAQHNLPLATADHLSPVFADIFPDSKIAKSFASAKTKTTCMLNGAVAPAFRSELVEKMKAQPYSLAIDGSNDTGLEKMNPLTVRIYDVNSSSVQFHFLDMCCTTGVQSATAQSIFSKMDEKLGLYDIPWRNCVAVGVDNASVNMGKRNSIKTRVLAENPECYFVGCPCHLVHNLACKASDSFSKEVGFDVEDLVVDLFYWFDKSTKRKSTLEEFCVFCDEEYKSVVKHVSTRWLSLQAAISRNLELFEGCRSYFLSAKESNCRFKRLKGMFENPMTKVYLQFHESVLPIFCNFNQFLQREEPLIHLVYGELCSFMRKLFGKFVTIEVIRDGLPVVCDVDFKPPGNQLSDEQMFIGQDTRNLLESLEVMGDISPQQRKQFFTAVRAFYVKAAEEAVMKLPWRDEHDVLKCARFVNVIDRHAATFEDVTFFTNRYKGLLNFTGEEINSLQEEFVEFQLMDDNSIPKDVWESAVVKLSEQGDKLYRMDTLWGYLSTVRLAGGPLVFGKLSQVAQLVLVIPHSNAGEERVFSMVRKNKTDFRGSLSLTGTLSSLLTVKMSNPESVTPCYKWEPSKEILTKAKSATRQYNQLHKK